MKVFLGLCMSYVIGSIPTAFLFGKYYRNIDIRQHGSGNVGATNAFRVLGKIPGSLVLFVDILKGIICVTLVGSFLGFDKVFLRILLGLFAVIGHNWTCFLKFKGGKGIATTLGVLIGLAIHVPQLGIVVLISCLIWTVVFLLSGYVSLASIIAAIFMPLLMVAKDQPFEIKILGVIFCIFVVLRHKPNLKRLFLGTESRVKFPFPPKRH